MELIERYIYAVTQQLPDDMKDDVRKELRSNIQDMLPDDYTEEDIKAVLGQLGNPWKIAEEYQPKQRYLIGPALYGQYFTVLKLVLGIVISVFAAITIMGWFFSPLNEVNSPSNYVDLFSELIGTIVMGALQAAVWVTVIFIAIERGWFGKTKHVKGITATEDRWSVSDLPPIPEQSKKISRSGSITSIIGTLLFTVVLYFHPQLIGVFTRNSDGDYTVYSLLEADRLQAYIPFILLIALLQLILFVWKYIAQYWNLRIWTAHTLISILIGILLIVMANDAALIHDRFLDNIAQLFDGSLSSLVEQWDVIVRVFVAAVVVITIWDAADTLIKTRKKAA